jgi:hypothetical protein
MQVLNSEQNNLAIELFHYNQLTPFTLTDIQIIDWVRSISELRKEITPEILKELIDGMKTTRFPFDKNLGIQNIFIAHDHLLGKYRTKLQYFL